MAVYYLYLALGENQAYCGFTHDPYLDSAFLAGRGYTRLIVASQPLPIDLAVAMASDLREKTGAYNLRASPHLSSLTYNDPLFRVSRPALGPLSFIRFIASSLTRRGQEEAFGKGKSHWDLSKTKRSWLRLIRRHFRRQGLDRWREIEFREIEAEQRLIGGMSVEVLELLEAIGRLIEGRVLSYDEVRSLLEQWGVVSPYPLRDLLQAGALAGKLRIWPGIISPLPDYHVCCRCGERQQFDKIECPLCGRSSCVACLACRSLGEVRSCRELYYGSLQEFPKVREVFPGLKPRLEFQLTRAQAEAAAEFKRYVDNWLNSYFAAGGQQAPSREQPESRVRGQEVIAAPQSPGFSLTGFSQEMSQAGEANWCLIWAVCGAGKTEIAFEGLALAIGAGLRAVFAVPRRDVVVEVAERAKAAFPEIVITALYGGAKQPEALGPLVVATTHQLIRFNSYFDIVILDEADAFPYAGSAMLHRALQRAVKSGGLKVFMTATPAPSMLQAARRGRVHLITVPVRHHGYPVPVPKVILCRRHLVPEHWGSRTSRDGPPILELPQEFWLKLKYSVAAGSRVFVFVPRIWLVEAVAGEIAACSHLSSVPVFATHSRDPKRDEQRELFGRTAPSVMVTTSVLERGITVPKADVIVLYAHDDLYDARTLIQMAGRSGRAASYPIGSVYFLAAANTRSIQWAIDSLEEINADARQRGLLAAGSEAENCQT
ncbi:MAG: DEAD/DEAH box helicase family protein [Firmicutes bacterium]|nr:DEAD/DEAH box helicase family protein [Bacillota bacterium]